MRKAVIAALAGAVIFIGLAVVGGVFCAATLHVPRKKAAAPSNAAAISIVAADGANLRAWWLRPAASNGKCVIVLHGIADSSASSVGFAPMFLSQGYSVLVPDSRAHGESGGDVVTYGLLEKHDVVAWTAWMRAQGCGRIYGLGESLGAAILIQAAAVKPAFAAIVAESSYVDLQSVGEYRVSKRVPMPLAKLVVKTGMLYARLVYGFDFGEASPLAAIRQSETPILLIHGMNDSETPPWHSQQLAAANGKTSLWLVPNATHTAAWAAAPDEFRARVLGWFANR